MNITSQHITGFVVGVGVAGLGFYLYKKNQHTVDEFLRRQGIQLPALSDKDYAEMSLQELVAEKERLEDLIAERELSATGAA
ncbi:conserved hypothetical protein [Syntrophobacter sp. SbD1]|nr:conserved hypothetical protein [Syntrophobacter sp. SbD1]